MTCRHCNRPEAEHHEYEPVVVLPPGCKCDPDDWGVDPPPVCDRYDECQWMGNCINCRHERACHAPTGGDNEGG